MAVPELTEVVTVIVALSIASERLVEIIKGIIPGLSQENPDPVGERWRRVKLQVLAVLAGIATAALAKAALPGSFGEGAQPVMVVVGLGLLASGGSGFWNAILSYLLKVKDIKGVELKERKLDVATRASFRALEVLKHVEAVPPTQDALYVRVRAVIAKWAGESVTKVSCEGSLDELLTAQAKNALAPEFQDIARTYVSNARIIMQETGKLETVLEAYNLVGTRAGFAVVKCGDIPPLPAEV